MALDEQRAEARKIAARERVDRGVDARLLRHDMPCAPRDLRGQRVDLAPAFAWKPREMRDAERIGRGIDIRATRRVAAVAQRVSHA